MEYDKILYRCVSVDKCFACYVPIFYSLLQSTLMFLNFRTPENFAVIYLKFKQKPNLSVFHLKYASGIANSVAPDQTAPV